MKRTRSVTLVSLLFATCLLTAMAGEVPSASSPAEREIARLQLELEPRPDHAPALTQLALAWVRRARETADTSHYDRADRALDAALAAAPGDPAARQARIAVLLGRHRFSDAAEMGRALAADGLAQTATMTSYRFDAAMELGEYDEAWELLVRMLELSPGSPAVLARGAYLAELSGDLLGAGQLLESAMFDTPAAEVEDHAWYMTHLAHIDRQLGETDRAAERLDVALRLFPDYHYAVAERAKLAAATGDRHGAARWAGRRCELAPHPECFFDLGVALLGAGDTDGAAAAFARFEPAALAESESEDNANRQLVAYYLDHLAQPAKALRLAARERARRADVFTRTLHAAALAAVGQVEEALAEVRAVEAVGVVDSAIRERMAGIRRQAAGAAATGG